MKKDHKKTLLNYLEVKSNQGQAKYKLDELIKKLDDFIEAMKRRMFLEAQTGKGEGVQHAANCGHLLGVLLLDIGLAELELRAHSIAVSQIEQDVRK